MWEKDDDKSKQSKSMSWCRRCNIQWRSAGRYRIIALLVVFVTTAVSWLAVRRGPWTTDVLRSSKDALEEEQDLLDYMRTGQPDLTAKEEDYLFHELLNVHGNFPTNCGSEVPMLHPSIFPLEDMVTHNLPDQAWHNVKYKHGHSHAADLPALMHKTRLQVCLYAALDRWRRLSDELNMTRWAAHGGSAMAAKCSGAISPWDDDLDITVRDCSALEALWQEAGPVPSSVPRRAYFEENKWEGRMIDNEWILIKGNGKPRKIKHYFKEPDCCGWFKLKSIHQATAAPTDDISGMDIECLENSAPRERHPKQYCGFLQENAREDVVMFGPTTIQMVSEPVLDCYVKERYGKLSPCNFPYSSGEEEAMTPPPILGDPLLPTQDVVHHNDTTSPASTRKYLQNIEVSNMDYAIATWYMPKQLRQVWESQAGNGKQMKLTQQIPNLNKVEIDNSIARSHEACSNLLKRGGIKVVGFNAERGGHWDKFASLVQSVESLADADVILLNEMDIGMARSGNLHTTKRLAHALGMNYAWGLEFVELTRGTREEQQATKGHRDALSLHGNAILSKCPIYDPLIVRDELPSSYFTNHAVKHINANGYEKRLGGRMGLLVRISTNGQKDTERPNDKENSPHIVVGSVHKLSEADSNFMATHKYFEGTSGNKPSGIVLQGDFERPLCSFLGLNNVDMSNRYTYPAKCTPDLTLGHKRGDNYCSNMEVLRQDDATPPCWFEENTVVRLSDHAILSIVLGKESH